MRRALELFGFELGELGHHLTGRVGSNDVHTERDRVLCTGPADRRQRETKLWITLETESFGCADHCRRACRRSFGEVVDRQGGGPDWGRLR